MAIAMAVVVVGGTVLFGRPWAALASTGALCASVVDQPGPFAGRWRMFAAEIAATGLVTALGTLAQGSPLLVGLLVAATSLMTGLISAFGRRGLGIGVAAVLALLFGMGAPVQELDARLAHAAAFVLGGCAYASVALVLSALLDDRTRRLFVGEAILAFARYIDAKSGLYDSRIGPRAALEALLEAHADFTERAQAARDMIFAGRPTRSRRRWIAAILALFDAFDATLSTDADIDTLRASPHHHLVRRLRTAIAALADDVRSLAISLVTPAVRTLLPNRRDQRDAIAAEIARIAGAETDDPADIAAFRATFRKLDHTAVRLRRLAEALASGRDARLPDQLDLGAFMRSEPAGLNVLRAQLTLASPAMRYAIRLMLATSAGYALTLIFPAYIHGGWVMLTTALIMRANFSITRRRRDDRVVGNLAGCVVTILLVRYLPADALAACVIAAIATSHAFATVDYRITAFAACISALLQLHFVAPLAQPVLFERMFDTLIGAGLAWGLSYVLPSWEWSGIPRLVRGLRKANREFAALALRDAPSDQALRLARNRAQQIAATLSMTVRRLVDEPVLDRRALVTLNDLLAANYLFASDLASVRVLLRRRQGELDPDTTQSALGRARDAVTAALDASDNASPRHAAGSGVPKRSTVAAILLRHRLTHVETAARRTGALVATLLHER